MIPPLEAAWLNAIEEVATKQLDTWNASGTALATEVRALSDTYTTGRESLRRQEALRAARLKFFLPRDLPKIEFALAEVAHQQLLPAMGAAPRMPDYLPHPSPEPRYHVLDLGAGYGTTSFGLARYLARTLPAARVRVVIDAIDQDEVALRSFRDLATTLPKHLPQVPILEVNTRVSDFTKLRAAPGKYQFILLGLSLNEIATESDAQAAYLRGLTEALTDDGVLIVLEPALREIARNLQNVGEAFRVPNQDVRVVGPCPGFGICPLLGRARDWCHEDLEIDLPAALQPVARAAGLRYQGLSFSYLTLRKAKPQTKNTNFARVVGGPIESKGQREWQLCRPHCNSENQETLSLTMLRLNHRERDAHPRADALRRGVRVQLALTQPQETNVKHACRLGKDAQIAALEKI